MKWPRVMRSFEYCPSNIGFAGEQRVRPANEPTERPAKDRYYRASRKIHVKRLVRMVMRGKR